MSIVHDSVEVAHITLGEKCIVWFNLRPQCRNDDIYILQVHYAIVVGMHVVANLFSIAIRHGRHVIMPIEIMIAEANNHLAIVGRCPVPESIIAVGVLS